MSNDMLPMCAYLHGACYWVAHGHNRCFYRRSRLKSVPGCEFCVRSGHSFFLFRHNESDIGCYFSNTNNLIEEHL